MNDAYRNGFRKIYAAYSDESIRSLLDQGELAFDSESWGLLLEEAQKRSIPIPDNRPEKLSISLKSLLRKRLPTK